MGTQLQGHTSILLGTHPGAHDLRFHLVDRLGWVPVMDKETVHGVKSLDPRITHACDHQCPHCWANIYGKHMSVAMFRNVIHLAMVTGIQTIQFTGGEPTLNPAMIQMAMIAKGYGCNLILRTHGRHLADNWEKSSEIKWAEAAAGIFDEIIVSIDGTPEANFRMRPVIKKQKLLELAGEADYEKVRYSVAVQQFTETISGYESLSKIVGRRKNVSLKINTVVSTQNMHDMAAFGKLLSGKVAREQLRIDRWDFSQVYPSPESTPHEQDQYIITEHEFLTAVTDVSETSQNIAKRAKPNTEARCLIIDESGRTYFGGASNIELGSLGAGTTRIIADAIKQYDKMVDIAGQRAEKYLTYTPNRTNDLN